MENAIEVEGRKGVLVVRELWGGGKHKEAAGSYKRRGPEEGPSRKRAADGEQKEAIAVEGLKKVPVERELRRGSRRKQHDTKEVEGLRKLPVERELRGGTDGSSRKL